MAYLCVPSDLPGKLRFLICAINQAAHPLKGKIWFIGGRMMTRPVIWSEPERCLALTVQLGPSYSSAMTGASQILAVGPSICDDCDQDHHRSK
jgi:hypothetical protein